MLIVVFAWRRTIDDRDACAMGSVFCLRICPSRIPWGSPRAPVERTCPAPEMADEKPSPVIVLPHLPAPGAKRIARPHGVEPGYPKPSEDVDSRAGPVRRNVSFRAIHEGQRMAYPIARWVAEPGLTRPVNHVFRCVSRSPSRNPLVAGRVRRVHHQPMRAESGGADGGDAGNMVDSLTGSDTHG